VARCRCRRDVHRFHLTDLAAAVQLRQRACDSHVDDDWGFDLEVTYKPLMRRARLSGWSTWADGLGHWDAQYPPTGRGIMPTADSARQIASLGGAAVRAVPLPTGLAADRLDNSRSTDRLALDGGVRTRCSCSGGDRLPCVTGPASRRLYGNPRRVRQASRPGRHRRLPPSHFGRPKPRRTARAGRTREAETDTHE
jgi:hypothetical protein